ncbi:MAG: cytochrome c3 family protein [Janthinobacterium lividum]
MASAAAPDQPIPFNHQQHVQTAKLACNDCHEPTKTGVALAMPQPTKCMMCHVAIATEKPAIQRLAAAAAANENIAWVRVYRVPSFVTFSHKTHTSAGNKCEDCHGDVSNAVAIAPVKDMSMGGCIACHQAKGAPATCDTCHETQAKNGSSPFGADAVVLARLHLAAPAKQGSFSMTAWHQMFNTRSTAAALGTSLQSFLRAPSL